LAINTLSCRNKININEDIRTISKLNKNVKNIQNLLVDSIDYNNIFLKEIYNGLYEYNNFISVTKFDTIYNLSYTKLISKQDTLYYRVLFTKNYSENGNCHVVELFNNDTLYHFISPKKIEDSHPTLDYTFLKGKYFFEAERSGWYHPIDSKTYFYLNIDSLINVRGDSLPDLPVVDSISFSAVKY
jgi:hypothetical protein